MTDLEQKSAFEHFAKGERPLPQYYIETFVCPSDSTLSGSGSLTSYAANAGAASPASAQKPANGAFLNRVYDSKARVADGHWRDGKDRTLVFSERSDGARYDVIGWNGIGPSGHEGHEDEENYLDHEVLDEGEDRVWGPAFVWHKKPFACSLINGPSCACPETDVPPCQVISDTGRYPSDGCTLECNITDRSPNAKPSSEHGGGVNVAYGSGRAGFLRDTIDYEVFRSMMTLNGKVADAQDANYDDSDLE